MLSGNHLRGMTHTHSDILIYSKSHEDNFIETCEKHFKEVYKIWYVAFVNRVRLDRVNAGKTHKLTHLALVGLVSNRGGNFPQLTACPVSDSCMEKR